MGYKKKKHILYRQGYRLIKCADHPFADSKGFVKEHRIVVEQYLLNDDNSIIINGRKYLSSNFVVHHIDFNRLNNVPTNLLVMSISEHKSMHNKLYDKEYFLYYCQTFNLNPDVVKETRSDFKAGRYKKYIKEL